MIIFLQASRSLAEPHSSVSVHFVTALMSSSQRARGLPLFLVPPPIPSLIDFYKLFSLRMICPKYDSLCFFINVSNGLVANCPFFFSLLFLSSSIHDHTALLFTILHFFVIVIYLSFHMLFSPVIAALPHNDIKLPTVSLYIIYVVIICNSIHRRSKTGITIVGILTRH